MTLAAIRSIFEVGIDNAYTVPVVYDNVQETPPATFPYVYVSLTYSNMSEAILCFTANAIETINGTVQVSIYQKRGAGKLTAPPPTEQIGPWRGVAAETRCCCSEAI